jgi:hypothetical protein
MAANGIQKARRLAVASAALGAILLTSCSDDAKPVVRLTTTTSNPIPALPEVEIPIVATSTTAPPYTGPAVVGPDGGVPETTIREQSAASTSTTTIASQIVPNNQGSGTTIRPADEVPVVPTRVEEPAPSANGQPGEVILTDDEGNRLIYCPVTEDGQVPEVIAPPGADISTICPW